MLADIGCGIMDVMQIIDNKPLEKSLVTDKFGVGICMKEIGGDGCLVRNYT